MAEATYAYFVPAHGSGTLRIGYNAVNNAIMAGKQRECECGGTLAVCDCGAITCTKPSPCDLPRGFDALVFPGSYYEPAEYEYKCTDCSYDPDEGPDPDLAYEQWRDDQYDRW